MDVLAGYASTSSEDDSDDSRWGGRWSRMAIAAWNTPLVPIRSLDSATERATAAKARLKDYGEGDDGPSHAQPKTLPSAFDAFDEASLATRSMCMGPMHGRATISS